jgi:hypothetical protein
MSSVSVGIDFCHDDFEQRLPTIRRCLAYAFRSLRPDERREAVQEGVAAAWTMWTSMAKRGRNPSDVTATALGHWACRHVRAGQHVARRGEGGSKRELFNPRNGVRVYSLDEALFTDLKAPIPVIVATKIDFDEWLDAQPTRNRAVFLALASGESTNDVARHFALSAGRISQLRAEARAIWELYAQE